MLGFSDFFPFWEQLTGKQREEIETVSYTHLTLPTILRV